MSRLAKKPAATLAKLRAAAVSTAIVMVLLLAGQPGDAADQAKSARALAGNDVEHASEPWAGHREMPAGPVPKPTPADQLAPRPRFDSSLPQQPARSRWVVGEAVSVQVNVDVMGNNIPGDAANEPSMAIDPTSPHRIVIGWRQFDSVNSNFRQAGWANSVNSGQTWRNRGVIRPGTFSSDPVLDVDRQGDFYYYALQPFRDPSRPWACYLYKSFDGGVSWGQERYAFGGDKAWIGIDKALVDSSQDILMMWSPFFSCCPGAFTRSRNGGRSFEEPVLLPDLPFWGTVTASTNGSIYICGGTGKFGATAPVLRQTFQPNSASTEGGLTFETIARVDIGGATRGGSGPNPAGLLGQMWIASDNGGGPHFGNLYLLSSVNPSGPDPLDVMFTRSQNGGFTWSDPVRINDDAIGSNAWQWFGTMSLAPNGRIDAVWYDTRHSAGASHSELYYSFSRDGGRSWSANQALSPEFNHSRGYPQQNKLGDYIESISENDSLCVAYAATFNDEQDVYFLRVPAVADPCPLTTQDGMPLCDCNANGIDDLSDILDLTSADDDSNFIPDECELDFDGDGILDLYDPDIDGDFISNNQDICDFTPLGAPIQNNGRQVGDANQDCAVDATDFSLFQTCFSQSGPGVPPPFRFCTDQFDFHSDDELDLRDWAGFQAWFSGTNP